MNKPQLPSAVSTRLLEELKTSGLDVVPALAAAIKSIPEPDKQAKMLLELLRFLTPRFADVSVVLAPPSEEAPKLKTLSTEELNALVERVQEKTDYPL
jgi:wyosine [tRNA(Phe)-imidazoG37] synthetase (radical SAM superfamily)